jgi:hypothetical protein
MRRLTMGNAISFSACRRKAMQQANNKHDRGSQPSLHYGLHTRVLQSMDMLDVIICCVYVAAQA